MPLSCRSDSSQTEQNFEDMSTELISLVTAGDVEAVCTHLEDVKRLGWDPVVEVVSVEFGKRGQRSAVPCMLSKSHNSILVPARGFLSST